MVFEVFRSLNNKVAHLVNLGLIFLIHEDMDVSQVPFLNHLASALKFQLKTKI